MSLVAEMPLLVGQELSAVYECCRGLHTLRLAWCKSLQPQALMPLLKSTNDAVADAARIETALPLLRELDVSYCPLPAQAVQDLLCLGSRFEVRLLLNAQNQYKPE